MSQEEKPSMKNITLTNKRERILVAKRMIPVFFFLCDKFIKTNDGSNRLHSILNYRQIIVSSLRWFP